MMNLDQIRVSCCQKVLCPCQTKLLIRMRFRSMGVHSRSLEGYALSESQSLLNNCWQGQRTFWQQAYTNLVSSSSILHQVGFGYVTLFDVSESLSRHKCLKERCGRPRKTSWGNPFSPSPANPSSLTPENLLRLASRQMRVTAIRVLDSPSKRCC